MALKTFKQGVHPEGHKEGTRNEEIKIASTPTRVIIPLQQHTGAPCKPLVEVGEEVERGQKIGESEAFVSSPVHSSISGKVKAIVPAPHPNGTSVLSVIIEANGSEKGGFHSSDKVEKDFSQQEPAEIREIIKEAGIVGLGGAAFPTHVKLTPPEGKKIDTVIINGSECESYLSADHRLMLERPQDLLFGMKAIMRTVETTQGYIGIEVNKRDAIEKLRDLTFDEPNIEVIPLEVKYPQGAEKMLIEAILGREVPSGGLPLDVGVVVNNVGTAVAVAEAIKLGKPLIERVITVAGSGIKNPQNLLVKIGTPFEEVIKESGGFEKEVGAVLMGGPLMGLTQHTLEVPVVKGTSGILVLKKEDLDFTEAHPCIRCAMCVDACPIYLLPTRLALFTQHELWEELEDYGVLDCIECGCCSYVCPAKIPLLQWIRLGKSYVLEQKRK